VIIGMAYWQCQKKNKAIQKTFREVLMIIKKRIARVWLSCGIDILFIRPFCMYWLPIHWKRINWYYRKVCADVVFLFSDYRKLRRDEK
jgi:hypothetical protein